MSLLFVEVELMETLCSTSNSCVGIKGTSLLFVEVELMETLSRLSNALGCTELKSLLFVEVELMETSSPYRKTDIVQLKSRFYS